MHKHTNVWYACAYGEHSLWCINSYLSLNLQHKQKLNLLQYDSGIFTLDKTKQKL